MSVVTATISGSSGVMKPSWEVLSIDVHKEVNRIPWAQIALLDGDAAKRKFVISDDAFFEPGQEITIKLRYEGSKLPEATVFSGLVVRHAIEVSEHGMLLTVEMKDKALVMTRQRESAVYSQKTDSDVIGSLIGKYAGAKLGKGTLAATTAAHAQIVQYQCSDWDFMLARADANGMLVASENGTVSLTEIKFSGSVNHSFEFGISEIMNFEIEVDANNQFAEVQTIAWDVATKKLTQASKAADFTLRQGNVSAAKVAKATGGALQTLLDPTPQTPALGKAWANGALIKSRMAMLRGRVSVPGTGDIRCLDLMEIVGVGKRFNGITMVTGVRHRVDVNGWQTDVQFGLPDDVSRAPANVQDRPAAGQLPGVNGLQIGVVSDLVDPDGQYRIQVILPGIDEKTGAVWARQGLPDAGAGRGYYFRPEVGDEVIVGFFNDDPRQAVILGAMYGPANEPVPDMDASNADNLIKGIVSKTGLTLAFVDDEKPMFFIETPGKNKILFDDSGEVVQLSDQHGNAITMNKDGIEIKSAKNLTLSASGDVKISGNNVEVSSKKLKLDASGEVEISGSKVDVK